MSSQPLSEACIANYDHRQVLPSRQCRELQKAIILCHPSQTPWICGKVMRLLSRQRSERSRCSLTWNSFYAQEHSFGMEQLQKPGADTRNDIFSRTRDRSSAQSTLQSAQGRVPAQDPDISDPTFTTPSPPATRTFDRQARLAVPALTKPNATSSGERCSDVSIKNSSAEAFTQTKGYADLAGLEKWLGKDLLNKSRWFSRRPTLLAFNITMATVVLSVNIWALLHFPRFKSDTEDIGTLFSGDCRNVKIYNALIHVAINILSSALLSASNFSMQILVAPTRNIIDRAHSKRRWVQVGVPSIRNLLRIEWYRLILWICMAMSSIPLHFL